MHWKIGEAKQRFSEVVREARSEPQLIYNRGTFVAAVVNHEIFQVFKEWRERQGQLSLDEVFAELRRIADHEDYELEIPDRVDRQNAFADVPTGLPR